MKALFLSALLSVYSTWATSAKPVDLASAPVFSPAFYINTNPEVVNAGIKTPEQARQHWLSIGLDEGLQAAGNFHTKQYLHRYPSLAKKLSQNYTAAVEHFLTVGQKEGLLGYVDGGYEGRYTISDVTGQLFLSASLRMGGAVDSVVFNDTEFINAHDHGRELQVAWTFTPNGECFNPTEAGGRDDSSSAETKTIIDSISAGNGTLTSSVFPAFWMRPGDKETQFSGANCKVGSPALNTQDAYPFLFSKTVSMGCPGAGKDPCFTYSLAVVVGGSLPNYTVVEVEGPTGYHTGDFNVTVSLDNATGELVPFNDSKPLVISTGNLRSAFGVWAPPSQPSDYPPHYGSMHFVKGRSFADATQKWNVVWGLKPLPPFVVRRFESKVYICVGTQSDAAKCMLKVIQNHYATH